MKRNFLDIADEWGIDTLNSKELNTLILKNPYGEKADLKLKCNIPLKEEKALLNIPESLSTIVKNIIPTYSDAQKIILSGCYIINKSRIIGIKICFKKRDNKIESVTLSGGF